MRSIRWIPLAGLLPVLAALTLAVALTACSEPAGDNPVQEHLALHADPTYVCPMHPDVTSDQPGECPICGMDLVQRQPAGNNTVQEHLALHADPTYVCPMHPEVTSDEPGECPICGMNLVQRRPADREIIYYRHPHRPDVTSDVPMKDEMGMDYVPVYRGSEPSGGGVLITSEVRNNLGVRVAEAERGPLPRTVSAVGQVTYDESRVWHLHARAEGWVEQLHVSSVGDRVGRGDVLVEFYSPRLATAQEEYIQAIRMGGETLIAASRNRLRALGIGAGDIERIARAGVADGIVHYRSEMDGVVTALNVRDGMYVRPDTDMVVLADLNRVWVEADVLARQSGWLAAGVPATVRLDQLPGEALEGRLAYVYPEADPRTRAVRVRLQFDNPGEVLKPNSFATVTIREPDPEPLVHVPSEALIRTSNEARVIVESGANRFAPRPVVVAYESDGQAAVLSGLEAGERVVVSGQFMLDSEANLRGELDRITPPSAQ
jgi:Cu(I)/Ag(I) efflux system membrane fusion protein